MDPFTAIGLVGNIITFIDFAFEIVGTAKAIHSSTTGNTSENAELERRNERVTRLAKDLQCSKPQAAMTKDERQLNELAVDCVKLSGDLQKLLNELKTKKPGSKRAAFGAVVRNVRKRGKKSELEVKLEKCRETLHLQLTSTSRSETLRQLDRVLKSGELQKNELVSLQGNVEVLRSSLETKHLGSDDLEAICSVLNQSDQALAKVYSNLILDGLRYENMSDRFGDIMEAHVKTFDWIMGPTNVDSEEYDSDTEDGDSEGDDDAIQDNESNKSNKGENRLENETESDDESEAARDSLEEAERQRDENLRGVARDIFLNWLEHGNEIFHVSGKPGAGKSTLMKYLCEHDQTKELLELWSGNKQLIFAKFFFWRPGTEYQKSLKGLRRSLLHCVLDQCPDLIPTIFPNQWDNAKYHSTLYFDEDEVKRALDRTMKQDDVYDQRKFVFFIDGLDEFEGNHNDIVHLLVDWASKRSNIKICVSSREYLIFQERFAKYPRIRLHELTRHDISMYVQDTLAANEDFRSLYKADPRLADLGELIVDKSEGVFLWVSLAVRTIEQGLLAQDHFEDLIEKIDALPSELNDLFQYLFESIKRSHPKDRRAAIRTLAVVANYHLSERVPLELTHYSFLEDFERDSDFATKLPICDMNKHTFQARLKRSQKRVYEHCKGFLEVVDSREGTQAPFRGQHVKFIHRSITEFLQEKAVSQAMESDVHDFDLIGFSCQSWLAELKFLEPEEEYFTQGRQSTIPTKFVSDLNHFIMNKYDLGATGSRLCKVIDQLVSVVIKRVKEDRTSPWPIYRQSSLQSRKSNGANYEHNDIVRHPSMHIILCAMAHGVYEVLFMDIAEGLKLCPGQELDEMLGVALFSGPWGPWRTWVRARILASRLAKVLAYWFEHGVSVNSSGGFKECCSCWRTVLLCAVLGLRLLGWKKSTDPFEPVLRVFLLYGAESQFWLKFGPRYRGTKSAIEVVRVVLQFGNNREEPFEPFYVLDHPFSRSKSLIDLAEEKDGLLCFEDIVQFWFPRRGKVLKELIRRNMARGGVPDQSELNELKASPGWDLDVWKGITCEKDRPLFSEFIDESQLEKNGFSVPETPNTLYDRGDNFPGSKPLIERFEETLRLKNEASGDSPAFYQRDEGDGW
ncbi:uncharacterized protein PAC_19266 [Phialocephala subalpina]|uniref:Uncharacterized protein n=1 Tax=Phialocephala subalpina TaxID=576137 RepID=A0A1L7XWG1_9HELO|nr:uncharacterized protein PAC_19266 [Phialocephala subalpina]